jgi:head-tail adaptor
MSIASLRHRLILCRQEDVVTENGEFKLNRSSVVAIWASIKEKFPSNITNQGASTEDRNLRSHVIMSRYAPHINLSSMAWLYEARLKSSPRWFKILRVGQTETAGTLYFKVDARLTERGDHVVNPDTQANSPVVNLPAGMKL